MTWNPKSAGFPMAGDPHRFMRSWAWRAVMDNYGTRSKEEKDKNEKNERYSFKQGCSHDRSPPDV
jgi:hypothetical protein